MSGERLTENMYESKMKVEGVESGLAQGGWTESKKHAVRYLSNCVITSGN